MAGTGAGTDERSSAARAVELGATARRFVLLVLLLVIGARLMLVFWLPVIDPTEGRYIEIARKMLETGDWITPQFDYGVPFWGKPPLHTWLSALGMQLFGAGHFGARIFIFATAIATGWLCYAWVHRHWGRDLALLTIAAIAATLVFFGAAAFVVTDMAMVFGTTLSMVAFFNSVTAQKNRQLWGNLVFVGLAVGMLAKGPTAVVLTGIPLFLWLLLGNRWALLLRLPWLTGLALLLVLTVPWYVAAEMKTPGFLRYFIIGEHYERFVVPGWEGDLYGSGHARPKGLIWAYGLAFFLPWTLFAMALLAKPMRMVRAARALGNGAGMYLLLWALSPMILFTPAANILPSYVLPAIPAGAILVVLLGCAVWQGG
ncbi:MAG: glycosyltransferase family 39 protein, partial [Paracoccaceae bacterium]